MRNNPFRKWIAMILTTVMILTCAVASAETVYTRVTVDRDVAREVLTASGMPEDQLAAIDPFLALINALGFKTMSVQDGFQFDLVLNEESAFSLGFAADEEGISLASTLFPNYELTMKRETLTKLLETFMKNMPVTGTGEGTSNLLAMMPESMMTYINTFTEACSKAAVPGEPVKGEYEFEGVAFDTMVPVTVDVPAVKTAFHKMQEDMRKDGEVMEFIRGIAQSSGVTLDPEEHEKAVKEFEEHFPDSITATCYQKGEEAKPFYMTGQTTYEGKEEPSYEYTMLLMDEKTMTMTFTVHEQGITGRFALTENGVRIEYRQGEMSFIIDFRTEAGEPAVSICDLYYMNTEKPLISISVTAGTDGERTLPVTAEGKTVLTVEEMMSGESEAGSGLIADIMINGFSPLMTKISEAVPEAAEAITKMMTPQTSQETTSAPEKEAEPQAEADPSAWKTLADVLFLESGDRESTWDDEQYTYIFKYSGTQWMVTAAFSKEKNDAVSAVDFLADDRDEQINAILGPCEILSVVDLGTLALPQEELDQWIGKTGQDLLDAGWEYNGYYIDETGISVCMVNGSFQYNVSFAEELITTEVFGDQPENMASATITRIVFDGKSYNFSESDFIAQPVEE